VIAPATRRVSRGRAVWAVLLLVVALGGGAVYMTDTATLTSLGTEALTSLGVPPPRVATPSAPAKPSLPPAPSVPPPPVVVTRPPLVDIAQALRGLQAGSNAGVSLNDYASRVAAARVDVERLLPSAPEPARAQVQEVLDLHRLAVAAWRARTVGDREEWMQVGRDPAVELCAAVKRAADAAGPSTTAARARGVAIAGALQPLWACAAEKLATLDSRPAGG